MQSTILTPEEQQAMDTLCEFWKQYCALKGTSTTARNNACLAVHQLQSMIAIGALSRIDPAWKAP